MKLTEGIGCYRQIFAVESVEISVRRRCVMTGCSFWSGFDPEDGGSGTFRR